MTDPVRGRCWQGCSRSVNSAEVASDPSVEGCEPVSCEMVSCVNFPLDPFSSGVTDDEHADDGRADLSSARPSADEQADAAVSAKLSEDAQARGFIPDDVVVAEAPAPAPAQIPDEDAVGEASWPTRGHRAAAPRQDRPHAGLS